MANRSIVPGEHVRLDTSVLLGLPGEPEARLESVRELAAAIRTAAGPFDMVNAHHIGAVLLYLVDPYASACPRELDAPARFVPVDDIRLLTAEVAAGLDRTRLLERLAHLCGGGA